eukprot:14060008-Alexandrium_andersonii.AAC.1
MLPLCCLCVASTCSSATVASMLPLCCLNMLACLCVASRSPQECQEIVCQRHDGTTMPHECEV